VALVALPALGIALYGLLAAAVAETFARGSELRLVFVGLAALYAAGTYLGWHRTRWSTRATASFFLLWAMLGIAARRPGELYLLGRTTPVLASLFTLASVALAGVILARASRLPAWLRIAGAGLAAYATAGFGVAAWQGTAYGQLLRGSGLGPPPPLHWLQGPLLGVFLAVPVAIGWEVVRALRELRGAALRPWAARLGALAASVALAAVTVAAPPSGGSSVISGSIVPGHEDALSWSSEATAAPAPAASPAAAPSAGTPLPVLAQQAPSTGPSAPAAQPAADVVKDFTLPSARSDSLLRLADKHRGKVVLVNWARTSCGWPHRQAPRLANLYPGWKARGLEIIEVLDQGRSDMDGLADFLAIPGTSWPIGLNDQAEFRREIRPLGTGATPETYLISRAGEIRYLGLYRGESYWTKLQSAVEQALAEPVPAQPPIAPRKLLPAPPFELPTLAGGRVRLADFAGKPLIAHVFTAQTCDWANGVLADLHRQLGDRVAFLGLYLFEADDALRECVERHGTSYPVAIADGATQRAWTGGNKGWAVFFVTRDGRIFKRIVNSIENGIEDPVFGRYAKLLAEVRL